jgi:hypothetical protein
MTAACPLFIELCAGTAAVSLRLARARARPPVSRMGSKSGYADALLGLAGLRPGQGAGHYLWCEPDPGCRLLLEAYRDAALARAAADIIRGWAGEDPRALWERLRAEGPPRGPEASPGGQVFAHEVARWLYGSAASYSPRFPFDGYLDPEQGGRYGAGRLDVARKTAALPEVPATIAPDARAMDPREVARWQVLGAWAFRKGEPESGFNEGYVGARPATATEHGSLGRTAEHEARMTERMPTGLPATILPDAHAADPGPALPAGTVAILDPPYVGTTPYAHDLPRADVVAIARRWAAAGALVMVCEAEPIPELLADGWGYRDIAHARKGQARTFSRQSREVVTMNRAPVHVPAEQVGLFGGAR